jgi:hypothetical protein
MKVAVFDGSKEVNMVVRRKSFIWGEVPKSLISLVLGILATIAVLLVLSSLIVNPIDISGGITQEVQGRISIVFIGMIAGFGLGMASWMAGCDAFPSNKSQPHWKMCRVCASMGIVFGILAMLIYLVFISLLPALLPLLK